MVDFASLLHFSRDESCCGSLLSYKGLVSEVLLANFSLKGQIVNIWSFVTQEAKLSSLFFFFFFNLAVLGVSCSNKDPVYHKQDPRQPNKERNSIIKAMQLKK